MVDERLEFLAVIDKKDARINGLSEDVNNLRESMKGKDEAIKALSMTLI